MSSSWVHVCNVEVFWAESWSLFWAVYVLYFQGKTTFHKELYELFTITFRIVRSSSRRGRSGGYNCLQRRTPNTVLAYDKASSARRRIEPPET